MQTKNKLFWFPEHLKQPPSYNAMQTDSVNVMVKIWFSGLVDNNKLYR